MVVPLGNGPRLHSNEYLPYWEFAMRMQFISVWCLTEVCVLALTGCGASSTSNRAPTSGSGSATGESKWAQAKPLPPLDLARLNGYEVSVLATRGKPVGKETSFVDHIQEWSLNKSGQLIFLARKQSAEGSPADLYRVQAGGTEHLLAQRRDCEHSGRRFSHLNWAIQNDFGQILVSGRRQKSLKDSRLYLVEGDEITPCPDPGEDLTTQAFGSPSSASELDRERDLMFRRFGPQDQFHFLAADLDRNEPATIFAGTANKVRGILVAASDPSDPLRQFSSFSEIYGVNSRGQILFDAQVGRDRQRLYLYTPADKPNDPKSPAGTVQELARHGGRLAGTRLGAGAVSHRIGDRDSEIRYGQDTWSIAALSERGDVVLVATTEPPAETEDSQDGLFILRPGSSWKMAAATGSPLGQAKLSVASFSQVTINARGQVAFVARFASREQDERLFRMEAGDTLTELAHIGQTLKTGGKLLYLSGELSETTLPQILSGGQVVMEVTLDHASSHDQRMASVAIIDENGIVEALRLPDHLPEQPEFSNIGIRKLRVNDAGYLGVLYTNDSQEVLLLARPKYK